MFHGADTGQLQNVAQRLGESSGRTSELLRRGDHRSAVRGLGGPDADRFRQELFGSVTNGWRQLIERLHLSEDEMRAHADEQDQASDARDRRSPARTVVGTPTQPPRRTAMRGMPRILR